MRRRPRQARGAEAPVDGGCLERERERDGETREEREKKKLEKEEKSERGKRREERESFRNSFFFSSFFFFARPCPPLPVFNMRLPFCTQHSFRKIEKRKIKIIITQKKGERKENFFYALFGVFFFLFLFLLFALSLDPPIPNLFCTF